MAEDLTLGIEEEYLLVDPANGDLVAAPKELMEACASELAGQFAPEFLKCQIEVGTRVCASILEAREELLRLRSTVSRIADQFGLAPIAVSCHPFADWKDQDHTDRERYNELAQAMGGVARRLLICGMHVHLGIARQEDRIDTMKQLSYFLPHILSLSTSSPYWKGQDTGLASYRLTVFDNLPRTGLPPNFSGWAEYERTVGSLTELGVIEDATKIWWDLRPSARFPTIETRICDVQPRLKDTLALTAMVQCIARMLVRLRAKNQRWRIYDRFLIEENRWRAIRFGATEGLIDFGRHQIVPLTELIEELFELVAEDAHALGCTAEFEGLRDILVRGTSSERQRAVYAGNVSAGASPNAAMRSVVEHLIDEFHFDL